MMVLKWHQSYLAKEFNLRERRIVQIEEVNLINVVETEKMMLSPSMAG